MKYQTTQLNQGSETRSEDAACNLGSARINDGGLLVVLDGTAGRAGGLESPDDVHGLLIGNLAEDDVAAIKPGGLDGGDEEL